MEITKREVLLSIPIVIVMFCIGLFISNQISAYEADRNEVYDMAAQIKTQELFEYGMRTNLGNAFVYGTLQAVDTVSYPKVPGKYMRISQEKERYTRHTRTVTHSNGKRTWTTTEVYYTWDYVDSETKTCKKVTFLNNKFATSKIALPSKEYITTIYQSPTVRYNYYGVKAKYKGTLFADLNNKTIKSGAVFYENKGIEETLEWLESSYSVVVFWVLWIIFMAAVVSGFYYLDNRWLND